MSTLNNYEKSFAKEQVNDFITVIAQLGQAITPSLSAVPGSAPTDASGNHVASLTEAVMGITAGLYRIAEAIENLGHDNYVAADGIKRAVSDVSDSIDRFPTPNSL